MNDWKTKFKNETAKQIAEMMKKVPPWRKPHLPSENSGNASNALTRNRYSGINALLLDAASITKGFSSKYWATYRQWESLDLHVKKKPDDVEEGSWGTRIVTWEPFKEIKSNRRFHLMKTITVFNADQIFGLTSGDYKVKIDQDYPVLSEQIISASNAKVKIGNYSKPHYKNLPEDCICLPYKKKFKSELDFWSANFHELIHWAEWRTGWVGSDEQNELVCEIGASYLENEAHIPHCQDLTNYNKYLNVWLAEIESDYNYLFDSATQASRAVNFILSFIKEKDWEEAV